jgi:hypothetical protein
LAEVDVEGLSTEAEVEGLSTEAEVEGLSTEGTEADVEGLSAEADVESSRPSFFFELRHFATFSASASKPRRRSLCHCS